MPYRRKFAVTACLALILIAPRASRAADLLQKVPHDALGFLVVREVGSFDAKAQQLLTRLQLPFASPLAFLEATTGVGEGLDTQGDLLLAAVPDGVRGAEPKFCVWLPVADYNRFVSVLGSKPAPGITAVTVAGVDLLLAHDDQWALVMDPDERARMERLLAAPAAPPKQVSAWQRWIETNDVTVVALAGGLHDLLTWAAGMPRHQTAAPPEDAADDAIAPFDKDDVLPRNTRREHRTDDAIASQLRDSISALLHASPKMLQWAQAIDAMGCGLQLDDKDNVLAGVRAAWNKDSNLAPESSGGNAVLPPSCYDDGYFILHGAGTLPQPLTAVLAGAYVRLLVDDLKSEMELALDANTVSRFQEAVEQAAAAVRSAAVLTLAGKKEDGVYTNNFLVVRGAAAEAIVEGANEIMRLWNQMNREAEGGTRLVFDVEQLPIAGRTATHYTIDIAEADGAAPIPEVREAMEKLFGPGGKMRLIVVPADDHHVLLAMATPEQAERALRKLRETPTGWEGGPVTRLPGAMLPRKGDWQLYFSPYGYTRWQSRQMNAITGPVFGGPIARPFPPSPPIGLTGGIEDYELWIDAAAPAATVRGAGEYIRIQRMRNRR